MEPLTRNVRVIDEPGMVAKGLSPLRRRILAALGEPDSAAGLARQLGLSRQKVNYHLRELERLGFVELAETRRRRGCLERRMRVTARAFVIDPALFGDPEPGAGDRLSSAHLIARASQAVRDVARLQARASRSGRRLLTVTAELDVALPSPDAFAAFARDLAAAHAALAARHHRPDRAGARSFRVTTFVHPDAGAPEPARPRDGGGSP